MHTDNLTCEDIHTGPSDAKDIIKDAINESIERELPKHLTSGSDIIDAEVVVQVTIHTQIAEY